jgi:hypothetical protein
MISLLSTSCNKRENVSINTKVNNDKIQLWYYIGTDDTPYCNSIFKIVDSAKEFSEKNNIPLEIYGHNKDVLSYEDYIVKRNLAATNGNMIIIEDISYMRDLAKHHADYTKIDNYNKLLDVYKGGFCIPLGTRYSMESIENEAMQYYKISTKKPIIRYFDYLKIKQDMKKKGAKFELSRGEFFELKNYYLYINKLLLLNDKSKIINEKNNLKKMLKKSIIDVCNDILLYYNASNLELVNDYEKSFLRPIHDENSGLTIKGKATISNFIDPKFTIMNGGNDYIANKTFYFNPLKGAFSPSFYMYKNITNDKIYDLANYIVSEETYLRIIDEYNLSFIPVFKIDKAKDILKLNDKMEYIGDAGGSEEIREIINTGYDMLLNNKDSAKEMASGHFSNDEYGSSISLFMLDLINDIARELSGDKLSLESFDPNNKELNEIIDKKIDEFIINFSIREN